MNGFPLLTVIHSLFPLIYICTNCRHRITILVTWNTRHKPSHAWSVTTPALRQRRAHVDIKLWIINIRQRYKYFNQNLCHNIPENWNFSFDSKWLQIILNIIFSLHVMFKAIVWILHDNRFTYSKLIVEDVKSRIATSTPDQALIILAGTRNGQKLIHSNHKHNYEGNVLLTSCSWHSPLSSSTPST